MDRKLEAFGRAFRVRRGRAGLERRPGRALAAILSDAADPSARCALREVMGELGYDLTQLDDAAARRALDALGRSGELWLEEVPVQMRRAPAVDRPGGKPEPTEPVEPPVKEEHKYELIELVEYVDRGGDGTVGGAAGTSSKMPEHLARSEKKGAAFKQFINLGKDIDGAAARHPENGRWVDLRARIEWKSGDKSRSLAGKTIKWKMIETKHGSSSRPATLVVAAEKPGLAAKDETFEKTSTTDSKGWAKMRVHLSQYAGDEYKVEAVLDSADSEAIVGAAKKAGAYIVWRKFWYQTTKDQNSTAGTPTGAIAAYEKVGADQLAANTVVFKKTDTPAPPTGTYYPEGMLKTGSASATDWVVIGGHNRAFFWALLTKEKSKPVKGNLIMCDAQWDPGSLTTLQTFTMAAKTQEITLAVSPGNGAFLMPALSGTLLSGAKWRIKPAQKLIFDTVAPLPPGFPPKPAKMQGTLSDSNASIPLPRTSLKKITITLPADAPDPALGYQVEVVLKANYDQYWGGENVGGQMLITHPPGRSALIYNQVVGHEFGHSFNQAPDNDVPPTRPPTVPLPPKPPMDKRNSMSLVEHPTQYETEDGHGGQGPHCSFGAAKAAVTPRFPGGEFSNGTCIMFHRLTMTCSGEFCTNCQQHFRLEPMKTLV